MDLDLIAAVDVARSEYGITKRELFARAIRRELVGLGVIEQADEVDRNDPVQEQLPLTEEDKETSAA